MPPRFLIAGIGNIFLGDDAFGVEVVRRLAGRVFHDDVRVVDYGIRGFDLVYALLDDWDAVILVDAIARGSAPGTLYVIEPEPTSVEAWQANPAIDGHRTDPVRVLRLAAAMGAKVKYTILVGCEPSPLDDHDVQAGLSPVVEAAVPRAADLVESLVGKLLVGEDLGRRVS
jgi:hydrogenase maturation protease